MQIMQSHIFIMKKYIRLQMKQEHADSQRKIRMLKRENGAMRREVEICSQMFKQADQFHKSKSLRVFADAWFAFYS